MSIKSQDVVLMRAFGQVKNQLMEMAAHHCKALDLGTLQLGLVRRLNEHGTLSLAELSRLVGTDPAAIGRGIDTLVRKGWVQKVDDPQDRRRWKVSLSAKGQREAAKAEAVYAAVAQEFGAALRPAEKTQFLSFLERISHGLRAAHEGKP